MNYAATYFLRASGESRYQATSFSESLAYAMMDAIKSSPSMREVLHSLDAGSFEDISLNAMLTAMVNQFDITFGEAKNIDIASASFCAFPSIKEAMETMPFEEKRQVIDRMREYHRNVLNTYAQKAEENQEKEVTLWSRICAWCEVLVLR
tara:strand:+ start:13467 stop:13916 length:450 start_codon:yes stop_codon:yes gene_type:complete